MIDFVNYCPECAWCTLQSEDSCGNCGLDFEPFIRALRLLSPEREPKRVITLTTDITVRLIQSMGSDGMVAAAAKVSTDPGKALEWALERFRDDIAGLINYLMRNRHGTPFEHGAATFYVHAPVMVWWEWVRHRVGFSYNLESGRYRELEPVFWIPKRERRLRKGPKHKPSKPSFIPVDDATYLAIYDEKARAYQSAWDSYQRLIELGEANEAARSVLGFGVYYSGWVTCNPRSLMHFLSLRTEHESPEALFPSRPQQEIALAAKQCESMFAEGWPITYDAFVKNGRVGP